MVMDPARASMTALGAAYRRAYHYTHDTPKVFADRFAALFVSPEEATAIENGFIHILTQARPHLLVEGDRTVTLAHAIRTDTGTPLVLGRARYNEDLLDKAIHNGVTQYVLVGAGFDTFAWRRPDLRDRVQVFEIDHPTTQDVKWQRIQAAVLALPANLHLLPADLEVESVADVLRRSAYDPSETAFFAWLGVLSYLTRPAIEGTLKAIRSMAPKGGKIVFDYLTAKAFVPEHQSLALKLRFDRAKAVGEPYRTGFEPTELSDMLKPFGYDLKEDLGQAEQTRRYFHQRTDGICPVEYWHWAHASMRPW
jgi:methyltransferase (TIGR00027 family)